MLKGLTKIVAGIGLLIGIAPVTASASLISPGDILDGATFLGFTGGTDCSGGAFANCVATQQGVGIGMQGELASSVIYKRNWNDAGDPESIGSYATIDGSEFSLNISGGDGVWLNWSYTPDDGGDPDIHYFTVKQGSSYALFYSAPPLYSWGADIQTSLGYNGISHVSWFNSERHDVPEPGILGLIGIGLAGVGLARRRQTA